METVVFPNLYQKLKSIGIGDVIVVYGKVEADEESVRVVAQAVRLLDGRPWVITVEREEALAAVHETLRSHPGDTPIILRLRGERTTSRLAVPPRLWVDGSDGLRDALNRVEGVSFQ